MRRGSGIIIEISKDHFAGLWEDKNNGDKVGLHCPHCNGTMIEVKNVPSD